MAIQLPASPIRPLLIRILRQALHAVEAAAAVRRSVVKHGHALVIGSRRYDLRRYERVVVVGAGKATAPMARAMERILGPRLHSGLVIVKYGHACPTRLIEVREGGHPLPDRAGQSAAARLLAIATSLTKRDLLIVLLSGGASSLMPLPVRGVTLADKKRVTQQLLRCGATIGEINTVRKHLSRIKGGRLAEVTQATVATVILSDVLGDDVSAIASGPTVPDPTTFDDAIDCLKRYHLRRTVPPTVRTHLQRGARGLVPDTPKPGALVFRRTHHHIVGNVEAALMAAMQVARQTGLRTVLYSTALKGEARVTGRAFGSLAKRVMQIGNPVRKPCCLVAGGETTVTVTGNGKGGRAQEFAVAAARAIAGLRNVWVVALGTDGTDGPTDMAGAMVTGDTVAHAKRLGIELDQVLANHDTYPALRALRSHIKTGPTGTNVNDLYLLLIK
jgi:glycerate-2-kinase